VLKGYRGARLEDAARAHAQARALNARRGFRVAALRELLPDHAALALEPLAGVPVPVRGRSVEAFLNVGARLRAMQDGPVTGLRRFGAEDELAVLLQWRERAALAEVAPPEGFEEACRELTATAPGLPQAPPVPCHRDLHDGQLLLTPHGVALLDFDLLCAGDAALDPANLLAHLHLRALQGEEGADENAAHACGEALLEEVALAQHVRIQRRRLEREEEQGRDHRAAPLRASASARRPSRTSVAERCAQRGRRP